MTICNPAKTVKKSRIHAEPPTESLSNSLTHGKKAAGAQQRRRWVGMGRAIQSSVNTYTCSEIKSAIAASISHNEIVKVECDNTKATLEKIDNDENISDLDWATENDGSLDVWGTRLGEDFRIRLIAA
jgi:hypothetical protein